MLEEIQYWRIAPGERAEFWEYCKDKGVIGIGGDVGNLERYQDLEELKKVYEREWQDYLKRKKDPKKSINNVCKQIWDFYVNIKIGDVIVANNGKSEIVGIGIVTSDYYFDPDKIQEDEEFYLCHFRDVKWIYTADRGNGYDISDKIKKNRWANITVSLLDKDRELIENVINELNLDLTLDGI